MTGDAAEIIREKGLAQIGSIDELKSIIDLILKENGDNVAFLKRGRGNKEMSEARARVAVFLSGGGSNLQSLIDATRAGILDADIVWVVSDRRKAFGLTRATNAGIEVKTYS